MLLRLGSDWEDAQADLSLRWAHRSLCWFVVLRLKLLLLYPTDDVCERLKPCHNGGSCTNKGQGRYECCCLPEFSGKHCDKQDLPPKPPGPHKGRNHC